MRSSVGFLACLYRVAYHDIPLSGASKSSSLFFAVSVVFREGLVNNRCLLFLEFVSWTRHSLSFHHN